MVLQPVRLHAVSMSSPYITTMSCGAACHISLPQYISRAENHCWDSVKALEAAAVVLGFTAAAEVTADCCDPDKYSLPTLAGKSC